MTSIRNLLNLFEEVIDPSKVVVDTGVIDPSKVVLDPPPGANRNKNQYRPSPNLIPFDKNVKAMQDEIVAAGGKFPKFGPDGKLGDETKGVINSDPKYTAIAKKYVDSIPEIKNIFAAKDQAQDVIRRNDGAVAPVVSGDNKFNSAAQVAPANDDERINSLVDQRMKAQQDAAEKAAKDAQLKALIKEPEAGSTGYAISPKNGMIYYTGPGKNNNQPAPLRLQDANSALYKDIFTMIKDAGLTVKGTPPRQSWTDWGEGYAMIDPAQLASVGTTQAVQGNSAAQKDTKQSPYSLLPPGTPPGLRPGEARLQAPMSPTSVLESDELNRIVSLVHHR